MNDSWIDFELVDDHDFCNAAAIGGVPLAFNLRLSGDEPLGKRGSPRYGAPRSTETSSSTMADRIVPHFHNDRGVAVIEIGAKEFKCVGALPPNDHPACVLRHGRRQRIHLPLLLDALPLRSHARSAHRAAGGLRAARRGLTAGRAPVAPSRNVIIAGAGIGGLTAALALAQRGFRAVVLDQASTLEEAGAGIQLSPNATRVLIGLGLEQRLIANAVVPEAVEIRTSRGRILSRIPLGDHAEQRYSAPYWVTHRADLQARWSKPCAPTPTSR